MTTFAHYELNTSDPGKARRFYKSVFGWKYQDMPMPDGVYTMVSSKDGPIGGIQQNPMKGGSHWLGYLTVASIDRTSAKVKKGGGKVLVPKMTVPNMGSYGVYADPTGAVFGVWEAAKPAKKAAKKSTKKKAAKKSTKKAAKKSTKKKAAKKSTKKAAKKSTKKAAKKSTKKKAAKKSTKKKAAKKTQRKRR